MYDPALEAKRHENEAQSYQNSLKIHNGKGKYILRKILSNYVPSKLINRPKQGFAVTIGSWLNGPLKDWSENLLSEKSLNETGFLILFWIHFITINLFCGSWIVNDSRKLSMSKFLVFMPLIITYFTGPLGIFFYWIIKT